MENAKIEITKSKKGKLNAKIYLNNGKTMPLIGFELNEDMNGKECQVERVNGQIKRVLIDGKDLERLQNNHKSSASLHRNKNYNHGYNNTGENFDKKTENIETARAPYNFIPLNNKVVSWREPKPFNKYHDELNTGYIDVEIEAKTPIFIKKKTDNSEFYKQAGKYRIPGSSLRGMIRTMVEIVSWSEFGFFNDDYLYFRTFMDKAHSIRDEYKRKIMNFNESGNIYKMNPGFLIKKELNYYIIPAKKIERINKNNIDKRKIGEKIYSEKIKTPSGRAELYASEYKVGNNVYLIVSGPMNNKKHDWLIYGNPLDDKEKIKINNKDIESYLNDKNRKSVNLINCLKKTRKTRFDFVPCFYIEWIDKDGNKRISFGHTALFRISYEKSIGEHILQNNDGDIDLAKSVFGIENQFMTRVFFEDAFLLDESKDKIEREPKVPKTLMGPKPTSFQHYLDQSNIKDIRQLNHYNTSGVNIRGNKIYWHKEIMHQKTWKEYSNYNDRVDTKIKPINPGAKFKGRIRFENLTDEELGALLFVLDLPDGLCHKIGMGKPLGLGSVKITPNLYLSNRKERYENILSEWEGLQEAGEEVKEFKKKFEQFILKEIGETSKKSLWDTDRLNELKIMLDFKNKPQNSKTEYMRLEEFKKRNILPVPSKMR